MGFFSWNCNKCGRAVMNAEGLPPEEMWMTMAVAILPDGTTFRGTYDGYGRVDGKQLPLDLEPGLWHLRCYDNDPYEASTSARNQGYAGFREENILKDDEWEDE